MSKPGLEILQFTAAVLFLAVLVISRLVLIHYGNTGIYGLGGLIGLVDVDAFILGMTQSAGTFTSGALAAKGGLAQPFTLDQNRVAPSLSRVPRETGWE